MFKKIFCLILILKLTQARNGFVPKLYSPDRAAFVDAEISIAQSNKNMIKYPNRIRMPPPFPLWRHYPRYQVIPPPPPGQILAINAWAKTANSKPVAVPTTTSTTSTTTTTTTTTPKPTTTTGTTATPTSPPFIADDEFPSELLDIAQNKLGLKSLDEIPSISELGQLLGTNSTEDTLKYITQLTSNEQGVELMKAYIESSDYTDNSGGFKNKIDDLADDDDEEEDDIGDIEEPVKVSDEGLIVINDDDYGDYELNTEDEEQDVTNVKPTLKPRKTLKITQERKGLSNTHSSFMERVVNYMHLNNLFHKNKQESESDTKLTENKEYHQLNRITENGKKVYNKQKSTTTDNQENQTYSEIINPHGNENVNFKTPILVRDSIPFNYPVPIRVQSTTTTTTSLPPTTIAPTANTPTMVHLNTPKMLIPHVQHLARVTKIPSKKIEDFLASKPKLLELATKISRFPIGYDRNSPMEAQVIAAVQRAVEKDEDLKKLLSSTATLK